MLAAKTGYINDRFDIWLLRLNDQFDTLWTRILPQRPLNLQQTEDPFGFTAVADSGFILCGMKLVGVSFRAIIYHLDTSGAITWTQTYGGSPNGDNTFMWPISLQDGGFLLAGRYVDSVTYDQNTYLVRTDAFGQQALQTIIPFRPVTMFHLSLFPNPVNGRLNWKCDDVLVRDLTLELLSMDGKTVLSKKDLPAEGSMELEGVTPGSYLVRFRTDDRLSVSKLVVE
jgi:hypothetical protein